MMTRDALDNTRATGWLADNWHRLGMDPGRPAVVLNPDATDLDCLAWLWGEVQALLVTTLALSEGGGAVERDDLKHIYQHRLEPMASVIEAVVNRCQAVAMSGANGAAASGGTA